jgi:pyruvate-ferredoxin/flavodoxin oxidoreductase
LDSKPPSLALSKYVNNEVRYTMLLQSNKEAAEQLLKQAQEDVKARWNFYEQLATMNVKREA